MTKRASTILLVLATAGIGCSGDTGVTKFNAEPDPTIVSPADGASIDIGATVELVGAASDPDDAAGTLSATWAVDGVEACAGAVGADGATRCDWTVTSASASITLTVSDPEGATGTDAITLLGIANEAPVARIDAPTEGLVVGEGEAVAFAGVVGDAEDAAGTLDVVWTSDQDGVLDESPPDSAGGVAFTTTALTVGTHTVVLTATDSDGAFAEAQVVLTVDGLPTAPTVTLGPDPAGTDDDLVATVVADGIDPEGAPVRYRYEWFVDGLLSAAGDGATFPATETTRGQTIGVLVYPSDGVYEGPPGAAEREIGNSAPTVAEVTLTPDPAAVTDTLTCAAVGAVDADGDGVTLAWAWEVAGARVAVTDPTLSPSWFAAGDAVRCFAQPTDGLDPGAEVASNLVVIGNSPPEGASVTLYPSTPDTDDVLTALAAATDPDGDRVTWAYTWLVDGAVVAATGDTLDGAIWFDRGQTVQVLATPSDGVSSGATATSAVVTVGNSAPTLSGVSLSPAPAYEDSTLTCTPGATGDADGDAVVVDYAWEVDGARIAATTATLDGAHFDKGRSVRCLVTPRDGSDAGATVASDLVDVLDSAPVRAVVSLTPDPPYTDEALTAVATASDVDGDPIAWDYAWFVDGVAQAETSDTLDGASFARDQLVEVWATPTGGTATGAPAYASTTVANRAPSLAALTLSPDPAYEASTLTCAPGATSDADADPVSLTYAWDVDGVRIAAAGSTLTGADFGRGDVVTCRARPDDGTDAGADVVSNAVTIGNTAPTGTTVSLTPSDPTTDTVLTATASAADADADGLSWSYAWYRNGSPLAASGATLNGATWFGRGDVVFVVATPSDGAATGPSATSASVTVGNTAPAAPVVEIQPADPIEGVDALRCVVTTPARDADGDSVTYTAAWTVDGSPFPGFSTSFTGDSIAASDTVAEEEWTCLVTTTDGTDAGGSASDSVFILGDPVDYAHVQYPCSVRVAAGGSFDVYAWVYEPAVTQGPGQGLGIEVQMGVGPDGSHPESDAGWTWTDATYNGDKDGPYPGDRANDEYAATLTAPGTPGAYDYAARVTTDGGLSWLFVDLGGDACSLTGTTDGYEPTTAGPLEVY